MRHFPAVCSDRTLIMILFLIFILTFDYKGNIFYSSAPRISDIFWRSDGSRYVFSVTFKSLTGCQIDNTHDHLCFSLTDDKSVA